MDKELLIKKVLLRRSIWDKRLTTYNNRNVVDECWREIAEEMGVEDRELRKKWKYLRDQFSVELGKAKPLHSGDHGGEAYVSRWIYFKSMLFLKDMVKARPSTNFMITERTTPAIQDEISEAGANTETIIKQEEIDIEDFDTNSTSVPQQDPTAATPNSQGIFSQKRHRQKSNSKYYETSIESDDRGAKDLETDLSNQKTESDELFFRSLLPYVAAIPPHLKLKFRTRIHEVVDEFAFSQGQQSSHFQQSSPLSSPSPTTSRSDIMPEYPGIQSSDDFCSGTSQIYNPR